jgi:pimeloyl-ACP methyl ester carboxylesterase
MATFALVHGGGHRGSHWDLVRPALARLGHDVVAPDVPMDDAAAGASEWADIVIEALGGANANDDDVVVVGHSLAGLTLPVIASRLPVRRMVFLCANVPVPRVTWVDYLSANPDAVVMPWDRIAHDDQGRNIVPWDTARELFYPDCDEALAKDAHARLTPVAQTAFTEPCPLGAWPDVPSTYILGQEDKIVGPSWGRRVSVERLGAPAIELPGSHSPFLSRPEHLATVLDEVAALPSTRAVTAKGDDRLMGVREDRG